MTAAQEAELLSTLKKIEGHMASASRYREGPAYLLAVTTRWERMNKTPTSRRAGVARLTTLLKRVATLRPAVVCVLDRFLSEMLDQLDPEAR